mmetsp:Transcript_94670/g.185664  ORF Transcript_94670/g.185664 Transcript_94670/m.185664 type:complete len:107 (+) Transcript_94670:169-489(+)
MAPVDHLTCAHATPNGMAVLLIALNVSVLLELLGPTKHTLQMLPIKKPNAPMLEYVIDRQETVNAFLDSLEMLVNEALARPTVPDMVFAVRLAMSPSTKDLTTIQQ